jgi:hypothetical protein
MKNAALEAQIHTVSSESNNDKRSIKVLEQKLCTSDLHYQRLYNAARKQGVCLSSISAEMELQTPLRDKENGSSTSNG